MKPKFSAETSSSVSFSSSFRAFGPAIDKPHISYPRARKVTEAPPASVKATCCVSNHRS